MNKDQALSLLKLIADLYKLIEQPTPVEIEPEKPDLKSVQVK